MGDFVTLTCPSCGAQISVAGDSGRFRCEYCGNEHLLKVSAEAIPTKQKPIRPHVPVPDSITIEKDGKSARLLKRWFSPTYIGMLIFVIPWDLFLCFWYSVAIGGSMNGNGPPWIFFVFPIGHLAIGIALTYSTLTGFFNRTVVELTAKELAVWFEPFPWFGEKTYLTKDIKQIYCKEKMSTSRKGNVSKQYDLYVVTQDIKQKLLLSNIDSPDVALFFEQQLETWMRIPDQPVVGELKKGF